MDGLIKKEGNIGVYYPDTYDDNSIHGIRAVCQKPECQQKEKELYEAEERKFNDKINKDKGQKESYKNTKKQAEEKLNNLQQQRINQTFTCRGTCGKFIGLNEKAYT
ncbi:12432_t:CDS:2 [Ambispora gerdemannii]|uniref:12432_t:CDS:1 n=1 Tax=Ambispora gerdemannii TaxID=144530 RepID=A0A9N9A796_9GLOM|nr:12432_t:CDS:2 [Ambispora gerdemannii]